MPLWRILELWRACITSRFRRKDLTETGKRTEQSLATREALKLSNAL